MKAERYNVGKPQLSYLLTAPRAAEALARVMEQGAKKYARDNWKKGLPREELIDSLLRHLLAYHNGALMDAESRQPHVAHILANALFLAELELRGDYAQEVAEKLSRDLAAEKHKLT